MPLAIYNKSITGQNLLLFSKLGHIKKIVCFIFTHSYKELVDKTRNSRYTEVAYLLGENLK